MKTDTIGHRLLTACVAVALLAVPALAGCGDWAVSLGLAQLSGGIEVSRTVLMAGSVVPTLPIVIVFFAAERLLTEGLTAGADKG